MIVNAFGRRARNVKPDLPQEGDSTSARFSKAAGVGATITVLLFCSLVALAVTVSAYIGKNWYWTLSVAKPNLLEEASITNSTPRVFPYWDASLLDAKSMGNIVRTLVDFHQLCGNAPAKAHWRRFYETLNLSAADQDDLAKYRSDRYDPFAVRADVVGKASADKVKFCSREYWEAFFDARVLANKFIQAQSEPKHTVSKHPQKPAAEPVKADNRAIEPSFNIGNMCARKWPSKFSMQEFCINNEESAKSWSRTASVDDDVRHNCAGKWPESWSMYQFCANNEQQAKDRLGR